MRAVSIAGLVGLAACSERTFIEPHPTHLDPSEGTRGTATPVTIVGDGFAVRVAVDLVRDAVKVTDSFTARLGDTPLQDVTYVDRHSLRAVVPPTLAQGLYSLHLVDPNGRPGTLVDAFTVLPDPCDSDGDTFASVGCGGPDCDDDPLGCGAGCNPGITMDGCDGSDNDCDGMVDEDFMVAPTTCGIGACAAAGTLDCVGGAPVDSCSPGAPLSVMDVTCDGVDDDCDGLADEDFIASPTNCGTGACAAAGTFDCIGGAAADDCVPSAPLSVMDVTCDGVDDDCDGTPDEDFIASPTSCGIGACAAAGTRDCIGGGPLDDCVPGAPLAATDVTCDGVDDDCDGAPDDEWVADTTCGVGECQANNTPGTCVAGMGTPCMPGVPGTEGPAGNGTCMDGLDNDCDTQVDLADGDCTATNPACSDGLDNDGDSAIDFPTDPGCVDANDTDELNTLPPESCTAQTAVLITDTGIVSGSTQSATNDYTGSCGGGTARDHVYYVEVPVDAAGLLIATDGPATNYDTLIYLRDDCEGAGSEIDCDDDDGSGNRSMIRTGPIAAGTYFVFIDGFGTGGQSRGSYDGMVQILVDAGRACHPGRDLIRCLPELECQLDVPTGENICAAAPCPVEQILNGSATVTGTTVGSPNFRAGTCGQGSTGGIRAPERMYQLSLATAVSNVNVSTANPGTDFDTLIYMRDACDGSELACDDDASGLQSIIDSGPLVAGDYYLFIDGFSTQSGNYEATITVTP